MSQKTKCLTNGAIFHTHIKQASIAVKIDIPFELNIGKKEAKILTKLIHNQMELVLRPYFKQTNR